MARRVLSASPNFFKYSKVLIILPSKENRRPVKRGRGLAWSKIRAWGVRGPGFKSPRPHQQHLRFHRRIESLTFSEELDVVHVGDVFKASFNDLCRNNFFLLWHIGERGVLRKIGVKISFKLGIAPLRRHPCPRRHQRGAIYRVRSRVSFCPVS